MTRLPDFDPDRRTTMKALGLGLLAAAAPGGVVRADLFAEAREMDVSDVYMAALEPQPDVETKAWGVTGFQHRAGELVFALAVARLENTTMAHVHEDEILGPIAVWLHDFESREQRLVEGSYTGLVNAGTITDGAVAEGSAEEATSGSVADLIERIDAGEAYVNVHTQTNPGGEIGGRVEPFDWSDGHAE